MLTQMPKSSDSDTSWCTVILNESTIRAEVKHVGRGKFRIIDDKSDGKYIGMIVDASDIFHCRS